MEIVESYYENGNAKEFIITKDGNHIGDGDYNESGEKHEIIWETENGNTIHRYYGKNGKLEKLEEIESISDDEFIETVRYFNQDETSYLELNFKNELLVGAGQKIQEEEYQNDEIISVVGFTSNVTGLNDEEDTKND